VNFTERQELILRDDVNKAIALSIRCATALSSGQRGGLQPEVSQLLLDTFAIDGSDPDEVDPIWGVFARFPLRMSAVEMIHTVRHNPDAKHMGYAAFIDFPNRGIRPYLNEIYVTDGYFDTNAQLDRVVTLIHETFHLLINTSGHPGSGDADLGLRPMGIPYDQAVNNAYCYDHFAKWL
jgi:hypothetical protein